MTAAAESVPEAEITYQVVVNHEEQYSIWPADREPPAGWRADGVTGAESVCLEHIEAVWTDMRPLSLRRSLGETPHGTR
ncbi:MbtH family protein [Streptomyces sp. NPDC057690]|uniref:MbtH family protein n=1 Tax=Streptomyces sp. NPDC057690 TaxID=3346214 RepID=UPI0036CAA892